MGYRWELSNTNKEVSGSIPGVSLKILIWKEASKAAMTLKIKKMDMDAVLFHLTQ